MSNNYIVERQGDVVAVSPIRRISELHQLQFTMLGNDFESIFLPSVIVIVEGDSDLAFLSKVITLRVPDKRIAIVRAFGDGGVLSKLNVLRETFGSLDASPYQNRLFVLLDKKCSVRKDRIVSAGVISANVKVWSKNGIEYYYPFKLIANAFRCEPAEVAVINVEKDPIEYNGITLSKKELSKCVSDQLTGTERFDEEFEGFLQQIVAASQ